MKSIPEFLCSLSLRDLEHWYMEGLSTVQAAIRATGATPALTLSAGAFERKSGKARLGHVVKTGHRSAEGRHSGASPHGGKGKRREELISILRQGPMQKEQVYAAWEKIEVGGRAISDAERDKLHEQHRFLLRYYTGNGTIVSAGSGKIRLAQQGSLLAEAHEQEEMNREQSNRKSNILREKIE